MITHRAHTATDVFVTEVRPSTKGRGTRTRLEHLPHEVHQTPQIPVLQDAFHQ
jgi:translation initiation factor 2B subunit (eIF-2B alpha/beta/delta family)